MRCALLLAALALLLPRAAAAQVVRGEVVERGSGRPVAAALVVLLDAGGARRGAALTGQDGRFELRAPSAGTYTLRAERVGYRSIASPPLALAAGQTLEYRLESGAEAVTLEGITARGTRRCRPRPGAAQATAVLWEEARKALSAAAHVYDAELLDFDLVLYRRDLHPASLSVESDERERRSGQARTPFASQPVEYLSRHGFVREEGDSTVFDAPDAHVLLSDLFLDDHCFRVEEDEEHAGMVGLAFEPVPARHRTPEVAGVLWLDRRTAELRRLEYRYVNLPAPLMSAGAGGRVEFERLPTGKWIVSRWWIRMPIFGRTAEIGRISGGREPILARFGSELRWIREGGGEVVSTSVREAGRTGGAAGAQRAAAGAGRISGVVWDSLGGGPAAGARVFLSGTQWSAVADSAGRFVLDGVPEGRYTASFAHPALAAWGAVPGSSPVEVRAGEEGRVALGTPSRATRVARACPAGEPERFPGVVMGVVTREGRPQARVKVALTWRGYNVVSGSVFTRSTGMEAETDDNGFYAVCGLPTDLELHVEVASAGATFRDRLSLRGQPFARHDIRLDASRNGP
ncbi:MAG TPA: carboxypeptidase regulatory-like domain-containing protein [Longimicrobium sp.]